MGEVVVSPFSSFSLHFFVSTTSWDRGSFFVPLTRAHLSLLYLVAISKTKSERGIRIRNKKKRKIKKEENTYFSLLGVFSQNVFRRLRSKTEIIQMTRIHQIVKVVDPASKRQSNFNSALITTLQYRTFRSYKTSIKRTITYMKQRSF